MTVREISGVSVISTKPRLDIINAHELKETVEEISRAGQLRVVIDMARTEHIDSFGCLALVTIKKELAKRDGYLKIACPGPQPLGIFNLMELNTVLEIHDSVQSAVDSFF